MSYRNYVITAIYSITNRRNLLQIMSYRNYVTTAIYSKQVAVIPYINYAIICCTTSV